MSDRGLACSSFEELMIAQDTPAYPFDVWVRVRIAGKFDRGRLASAVAAWTRRNPLLRSRVERRFWGHQWIQCDHRATIVWLDASHDPWDWPESKPLDLQAGEGIHLYVSTAELENSTIVFFQVHHAVADGLGILQAIDELFCLYANLKDLDFASDEWSGFNHLRRRNTFGLTVFSIVRLIPSQLVGLAGVWQFLSRLPVPLIDRKIPETPLFKVSSYSWRISAIDWDLLRASAQQRGVTINDLMAAAILRGIANFRSRYGESKGKNWMRMMVPVNLRTSGDKQRYSACNIVSSVFLDRTPAQTENFEELLQSIHDEMELIKRNRLALLFNFSLWVSKWFYLDRLRPKKPATCQATAVFSNLGKLQEPVALNTAVAKSIAAPSPEIQQIEIVPPLAPMTLVAFALTSHSGRGCLTLRYDDRVIEERDAELLMSFTRDVITNFLIA